MAYNVCEFNRDVGFGDVRNPLYVQYQGDIEIRLVAKYVMVRMRRFILRKIPILCRGACGYTTAGVYARKGHRGHSHI